MNVQVQKTLNVIGRLVGFNDEVSKEVKVYKPTGPPKPAEKFGALYFPSNAERGTGQTS